MRAPSTNAFSTSATTAAGPLGAQRGQAVGCSTLDFDQQFVRFSDMVMQKMPPSSGTIVKRRAMAPFSAASTSGLLVHNE